NRSRAFALGLTDSRLRVALA
ncbi:hypothetical protein RRG08_014948, partial [Elysia crispata]